MNRIQYMTELASYLQDIPEAERKDAMQYYNDYFDEAGEENEEQVIAEFGSPAKVAENIKADLKGKDGSDYQEYRETGYADTRFEENEPPAQRTYGRQESQTPPRSSNLLKIILIIAIAIVALPVVVPLALGIAGVVIGVVATIFMAFVALVIASISILISGIVIIGVGIVAIIPELAAGLALIGSGLIVTVLGLIATVASVKLCIVVFPGIIRGLVWICRRPFQRKAVA